MALAAQIRLNIQEAQRDSSEAGKHRLRVLRLLTAALQNEEIALKAKEKGLTESQALAVARREVKKRRDAAQLYRTHGEEERAKAEEAEAAILAHYLPVAPDADTVQRTVAEIIAALPEAERNMGRIMKEAMAKFKGTADGAQVRDIVQQALAQKSK